MRRWMRRWSGLYGSTGVLCYCVKHMEYMKGRATQAKQDGKLVGEEGDWLGGGLVRKEIGELHGEWRVSG